MPTKRPSLTLRNLAWHKRYATVDARHAEFSDSFSGGLIEIRRNTETGKLQVILSRLDNDVEVVTHYDTPRVERERK